MEITTNRSLLEKRIYLVVVAFLVLLLIFAARLVDVQALRSGNLVVKAAHELQRTSVIPAPRGAITDINGIELARSVLSYRVVVDQKLIQNPKLAAKLLAPVLEMDQEYLTERLTGDRRYVVVANRVKPLIWRNLESTIARFNESVLSEHNGYAKRISGFWAERLYDREYPSGKLAASLIGFTNAEGVGAAGIEYSLNSILKGQDGAYTYANAGGAIIPGTQEILTESTPGQTVKLTIDRDVQWVAQSAIRKAVKKSQAISGTVIVQDPKTGELLAHATYPTFDPENRKGVDPLRFRNLSVEEVYEPGSTGKVITYAAAIEEGKISPESIITSPYKIKRYGYTFKNHDYHKTEKLTITGALANSTNTGAIKIGEMLGKEKLYEYLHKFGVGTSTGSHLPGESAGKLRPVKEWSGTSLPTFSFGHGYSVTAIQATSIFATIANDGVRVTPTVVAGVVSPTGSFTERKPLKSVRVISPETAAKMRLMMESVVGPGGTAASAAIPGYRVAGKTGTAVRYDSEFGGYRGYTASFIGFAPADNPAFVVSVTIQGPKGAYYGGYLGGPVFKEVMSYVLESRNIPPTANPTTPYALNYEEYKKKITNEALFQEEKNDLKREKQEKASQSAGGKSQVKRNG
jgi:cell division protein FtsI (penicillin-binding protein 3)